MTVAVLTLLALAAAAPLVHRLAPRAAGALLAAAPAASLAWLLARMPEVTRGASLAEEVPWVPSLGVSLAFRLDGLGLAFALLVTLVGALVLLYAGAYFRGDPRLGRLLPALLLFMGSMLGLVLADDALALFAFWELTSVSSYLLIGFDHENPKARASALQALLVTGGGGIALLVGLLLLGSQAGTLRLSELGEAADALRAGRLYLPVLLLVAAGAFTKSAQFPFHFWLPGAMAAPSPVSAYLHSATMVMAGVYLLARMQPALGGTPAWHRLLTLPGAITLLLGAAVAFRQRDLKLLLAWTTVSALGLLTLLLGIDTVAAVKAAVVFVLVHGLYKAALFLAVGNVDHGAGSRDLEALAGLRRAMPVTAAAAAAAALSMAGLPPLFGFIGKELVYEAKLGAPEFPGLVTAVGFAGSALVVAAAALLLRPFAGRAVRAPASPHEAPVAMLAAPVALAALGVVVGVAPDEVVGPLVDSAVAAVRPEPSGMPLALWHGFTLVVGLSAATVAAGLSAWALRRPLLAAAAPLEVLGRLGPRRLYEEGLRGLQAAAKAVAAAVQGRLRRDVLVAVAASAGAIAWPLLSRGGLSFPADPGPLLAPEAGVTAAMLAAALFATATSSRLAAVAALGAVGLGVSLLFLASGGPDLAMTQLAVEALTVLLFVLVLWRLPRFQRMSSPSEVARDAAVALAFGALVTAALWSAGSRPSTHVSDWLAAASVPLGKGRNVVNVILVDFRALDTLGEITVLATAALGIRALMRLRPGPGEEP
jgi:multicomponent Na+:H+ antiporter subunit A